MLTTTSLLAGSAIFAVFLGLIVFSLIVWRQRVAGRLLLARVATLQQKIESALNDDEGFEAQRIAFGKALQSASLTTKLQRPRLENLAKMNKQAPEKYRILSQLASQGLDVEEIAAILGVSSVEANQLLNLSNVAQMRQGA